MYPCWLRILDPAATPRKQRGIPASEPRSSALFERSVRHHIGTQIQSVAVGWQVYDITRDPVALGYVGLSIFLPMLLLVLPAGDLADRVDRRFMLMPVIWFRFLLLRFCWS